MKHVFIIDSKSFHGQQWKMDSMLDSIGQYFRTQEKPNFSTLFSHNPRDAMSIIQKQVSESEEDELVRVYAIGGDDILFDCLNSIVGLSNIELAIMPYGEENSFIRSFGEKKADLFKEVASLAESSTIPTDVIKVGYNCAIDGCAVGFTPAVTTQLKKANESLETGYTRFFARFLNSMKKLLSLFDRDLIAHQYEITIDDRDYSGSYSLINIVNGPYFGRIKTALPEAVPDDGLLDVLLFKAVGPLSTSRALGKYARGRIPSNCVRVQARKVDIKTEEPVWIQTDNEFLQDTRISFEVVPEAVQIVTVNNLAYQRF